jgi:hypothetical protein
MDAIETLLSRLEKVKQTGRGRWTARCPAHDDRGPSLAVRELDDGRVLLHCFAGCSVGEIVDAIGLTVSDLFPERETSHQHKPERRPFPAADVLRAIGFESLVVLAAAASVMAGQTFTATDRERLTLAVCRIRAALDAGGIHYE